MIEMDGNGYSGLIRSVYSSHQHHVLSRPHGPRRRQPDVQIPEEAQECAFAIFQDDREDLQDDG